MNGALLRSVCSAVLITALVGCSDDNNNNRNDPVEPPTPEPEFLPVSTPSVSAPPDIGSTVLISTFFDFADVGFVQEEFFLSGTATSFSNLNELGRDGRWEAEPADEAEYTTRVVVYRPENPADFSGTVVVEWLNVTQGFDVPVGWGAGHVEALRRGHAWVNVSAQLVGIEGVPGAALPLALKVADPERYAELSHPGDSFSYDIFTQVSAAIRDTSAEGILGGLQAELLIAGGESQSASRLLTYINAVQPLYNAYDAFLVDSRYDSSQALSQAPQAEILTPEQVTFRDDLASPVINFQGETDVIGLGSVDERQPDSDNFRLWEVAGIAHNDNYQLVAGRTDTGEGAQFAVVVENTSILGAFNCDLPINSGAYPWVYMAALRGLETWVREGTPAPQAERLATLDDDSDFVYDDRGNVVGGVRSPYVDAPPARMSGEENFGGPGCSLSGTTALFDAATMAALYVDRQGYVDAVNEAADAAVEARFLLQEDAERIRAAAGLQWDALGI
jgi:hypothetical protein